MPPRWKHRILYVGLDLTLLKFLQDTLDNCKVVRALGCDARLFIESDIKYSLLIFDKELPDETGAELAKFARQFPHRQQTPVLLVEKSDDLRMLVDGIMRLLG